MASWGSFAGGLGAYVMGSIIGSEGLTQFGKTTLKISGWILGARYGVGLLNSKTFIYFAIGSSAAVVANYASLSFMSYNGVRTTFTGWLNSWYFDKNKRGYNGKL